MLPFYYDLGRLHEGKKEKEKKKKASKHKGTEEHFLTLALVAH